MQWLLDESMFAVSIASTMEQQYRPGTRRVICAAL